MRRLRAWIARAAGAVPTVPLPELRDAFAFGGLAMAFYGVHAIYPPAAWVCCGIVLFWMGVKR